MRAPVRPALAPRPATKADAMTLEGEVQDVLQQIRALKEGEELTIITNMPPVKATSSRPASGEEPGRRERFDYQPSGAPAKAKARNSAFDQPVRWSNAEEREAAAPLKENLPRARKGFFSRLFGNTKKKPEPSAPEIKKPASSESTISMQPARPRKVKYDETHPSTPPLQ